MTLKEHKKHTDLERPAMGTFGRNEWAILGAPCEEIKSLADKIVRVLSPRHKCAYADAAHNDEALSLPGRLASGAVLEYTDCTDHRTVFYKNTLNASKLRSIFAEADLILVNGNHHQAKAQVVVIDPKKEASLQRRIGQLANVKLFLLAEGVTDLFDFIKDKVPGWENIPVYRFTETNKIVDFFKREMHTARPKLNGLVLAGGKSERMGFDKGAIDWHGKEQRYRVADMLSNFCDEVFISCREDQSQQLNNQYPAIKDTFTGLGPYGGILSAFREQPDRAWLVVACDLPLLSERTLQHLTDNRNVATIATAYQSPHDRFPEPLITIWEPKSYPTLLAFLAQGYSCPRKVLINSDITLLTAPYPEELTNVNTLQEYEQMKRKQEQKATV